MRSQEGCSEGLAIVDIQTLLRPPTLRKEDVNKKKLPYFIYCHHPPTPNFKACVQSKRHIILSRLIDRKTNKKIISSEIAKKKKTLILIGTILVLLSLILLKVICQPNI